ncbi:MAG: hypothetical protein Q8K58_08780 [Acidimicrobiales bacterium]|nr:hypothetical protein [Acidimicrobiales bacterium]
MDRLPVRRAGRVRLLAVPVQKLIEVLELGNLGLDVFQHRSGLVLEPVTDTAVTFGRTSASGGCRLVIVVAACRKATEDRRQDDDAREG